MKSKTKKLKIEFKNIETDLLKINKSISDLYQKIDHLDEDELRDEIKNLFESSEINIVKTEGFDNCFVTTVGTENKVNSLLLLINTATVLYRAIEKLKKRVNSMGKQALGFDFGTSNCTVSILTDKGIVETLPISNYSESKKEAWQINLYSSKVGLNDDFEYVFGDETKKCERDFVWDNSKRLLEHNTPIYRGGVHKKPVWVAIGIMAGIFKELKNLSVKTSSPMVITVPANSYSTQRSLTRLAAESFSFNVDQLVSEPVRPL